MTTQLKKKETSQLPRWAMTSAIICFILFLILTALLWTVFLYQGNFINKVYAQVKIEDLEITGMTKEQLRQALTNRINTLYEGGITLYMDKKVIQIPSQLGDPLNPELMSDLWFYDTETMVENAYSQGRKHPKTMTGTIQNVFDQFFLLQSGHTVPISLEINEALLQKQLKTHLLSYENPASEASLHITQQNGNFYIQTIKEKEGETFDYPYMISEIKQQLSSFTHPKIQIALQKEIPSIKEEQVKGLIPQISQILSQSKNIAFTYEEERWNVSKEQLSSLILIKPGKLGNPIIAIDEGGFSEYVEKNIHPDIAVEPMNAIFVMENNRVTQFKPSADGQKVNIQKAKELLEQALVSNMTEIPLPIDVIKTEVATESTNTLGIKELIGVGTSYFSGSPANRRHNIGVGTASLNGLLIAPNEEFSLLHALGEINADSGYRTELVIKGDRTIPEYGGGLCQIGTTLFRNALDTGLPITERRNHSYRVRYYEPAGTDATIYDPAPDFKFINDTGHHILLQTKISGDTAIFEMWGTSDGRIAEQSKPVVYNIVPAGPTKYVESDELQPGEEKCIESPHDGATAHFDYKVTYATGELKEERFISYYRPWPQVCLIGKSAPESLPSPSLITEPAIESSIP